MRRFGRITMKTADRQRCRPARISVVELYDRRATPGPSPGSPSPNYTPLVPIFNFAAQVEIEVRMFDDTAILRLYLKFMVKNSQSLFGSHCAIGRQTSSDDAVNALEQLFPFRWIVFVGTDGRPQKFGCRP